MRESSLTQLSALGWLRNSGNDEIRVVVPDVGEISLKRAKGAKMGCLTMPQPLLNQFERQYAVSNHMLLWGLRDELAQWVLDKLRTNEQKALARDRWQLENDLKCEPITEKSSISKVRKFQDRLRKLLLKERGACQISGVTEEGLLVASHIKAWSDCDPGACERLDPENVLLLACNWDSLFDKYYISFSPVTGKMLKAKRMSEVDLSKFGVPVDWRDSIGIGTPSNRRAKYLQWHNEKMNSLDEISRGG